ncbi:EPIDERMAL PATTERNING FACTOR-like protein 3 isoform X2 [Durio zibethinus]|uniref:Epidermal patterning factor-like protein n=1 Tax=Durio zibethinus TaxID=66656 RepID=A0A6P5WGE8_DURZI|nr:EPIDERMAL PATTERNING FACTOR-like protein 3 isoform X2 [Durio zibethinus]
MSVPKQHPKDSVSGHSPQSLQVSLGPSSSSKEISLQSFKSKEGMAATINKEANAEVDSKLGIGSSPPSCEHKCYGCIPCEAIQVPTTTKRSHVGLQYANYEPESWKCKCGPSLYSP